MTAAVLSILISVIPHAQQRYDTVGDWEFLLDGSRLEIRVSDTGDWRANMAVAYHELLEALACKQAGISQESVDAFDMNWTPHDGYEEPGDDPKSPYFFQHQMALAAEQVLLSTLGLGLADYEKLLGQFDTHGQNQGTSS